MRVGEVYNIFVEHIKKEAETQGFYGQLLQTINSYPKWREGFFAKLKSNNIASTAELDSYLQANDYFRNKVDLQTGTFIDDEDYESDISENLTPKENQMEKLIEVYQTSFNPETKEIYSQENITERFKGQIIGTDVLFYELNRKKEALNGGENNVYIDVVGINYEDLTYLSDDLKPYVPISPNSWSDNLESLNATLQSYSKDIFNLLKNKAETNSILEKSAEYSHRYIGFSKYDTHYLTKDKIEDLKSSLENHNLSKLKNFEIGEFYEVGEWHWKPNGFSFVGNNERETIEGSGSAFTLDSIMKEDNLIPINMETQATKEEIAILDQEVAKIDAEEQQKQTTSSTMKMG